MTVRSLQVKSQGGGTWLVEPVVSCLILSDMVTWRILVAGLCLTVLSLLAPRPSMGAPFLISDPYPINGDQHTRFVVITIKAQRKPRLSGGDDRRASK
jgi:hypothetical protein